MKLLQGFAPVANPDARILILGSMPGVASLEAGQYYAFRHNSFWRIMGDLFDAGPELGYHERLNKITANNIALWDVIASCYRPGSLDSAISEDGLVSNDFSNFFARQPHIKQVCFNGQKAAGLFKKLVQPTIERPLEYVALPSTSPAHAAMTYAEKLQAWSVVGSASRRDYTLEER